MRQTRPGRNAVDKNHSRVHTGPPRLSVSMETSESRRGRDLWHPGSREKPRNKARTQELTVGTFQHLVGARGTWEPVSMRSPSREATLNLPTQRLLPFSGRLSNHHLAAAVRDLEFSGSVVCILGAFFFPPPCESFALSALVATAERKRRIKVRVNQPEGKKEKISFWRRPWFS